MTTATELVAIVLTLNEAEHLPECLTSLRGLTENVIVFDSHSTDETQSIATSLGAEVCVHPFDGYASQRNAALDMTGSAQWVLFLDADERLSKEGVDEVLAAIGGVSSEVGAFYIPRRNYFFGREIRGGGWWPDYQARLLRHGRARFDPDREVHEVVQVDGTSLHLREPMIHLNYASRREFIVKQREYTRRRVRQAGPEALPRRRAYIGAPARELWRRFIRLRGYRDGHTGLFLAIVMAGEEARAVWLLRTGNRR